MMMHGESINKLSRVFMIINFVADFSVELAALEEFFFYCLIMQALHVLKHKYSYVTIQLQKRMLRP